VQFVVDVRGIPELETARVVQSNEPSFGQAVLATLANWRYEPAQKQGEAVRQIVRERRAVGFAVTVAATGQRSRPPSPPPCR
jgi:hypothetical protein